MLKPRKIEFFSDNKILINNICSGSNFSFVIDMEGKTYSFGDNTNGQLAKQTNFLGANPYPSLANFLQKLENIKSISCGWSHASLLTNSGDAYIWGNPFKEYKSALNIEDIIFPEKIIINPSDTAEIYEESKGLENNLNESQEISKKKFFITDISSGYNHTCFIVFNRNLKQKQLYSLGTNEFVTINIDY